MNAELLKACLGRLKRSEFCEFLREWGRLDETADVFSAAAERSVTKRQLVLTALRDCKKAGVTTSDIDVFALLHVYKNSKSKLWTTFQIEKDDENTQHRSLSANALKVRLSKELSKYFTVRVCILSRDDAFWLRMVISSEGTTRAETVIYAVHYPHTWYFYTTNIKATLHDYVTQAFSAAVGGISAESILLQGRCVRSLAQLSIGKDSQGSFSKFRLNQVDGNVLSSTQQKRKRQETEEEEFDVHVINENASDRKRRHTILENTFGSNTQPTLENVVYELETNFSGVEHAPAMAAHRAPFHCKIRFEGKSVIEGMRQLGRAGIADLPMKPHVGRIHSYAQNRFLLKRKDRKNTSAREG